MEPKPATAPTQYGCGTVILGCFILYLGFSIFGDDDRRRPAPARIDYCTDTNMARLMSEQFVTAQLKAPSTADFPLLPNAQSYATAVGNCAFTVYSYVDAQNSFGAMIRTPFTASLRYDAATDTWKLLGLSME